MFKISIVQFVTIPTLKKTNKIKYLSIPCNFFAYILDILVNKKKKDFVN